MNSDGYKEVYFDIYCRTCEYLAKMEEDEPCFDCLSSPTNLHSHKPTRYKETE